MRMGRPRTRLPVAWKTALVMAVCHAYKCDFAHYLDAECRTASAARHRLPLICGFKEMTQAGCLFSYAISLKEMWYRSATYVDKILKGAKPSQGLPPENAP
jgi:ABC-type uncharacterized transport system substrate-binding protein